MIAGGSEIRRPPPANIAEAELRLELPYTFSLAEYERILSDFVTLIAPALRWGFRGALPVTVRQGSAPLDA